MQRSTTLLRGVAGAGKRRATTQPTSRWFGAPCSSQQMKLDRGHRVPVLLVEIRNALDECEGFATEGIFRLAAEGARQRFVRERLEAGEEPEQVLCGCEVEVLAGLLKEWLRELPDGLWASVGAEAREEFERALGGSAATNVALLLKQAMPPAQREVFLWVLDLLADAAAHEASSKMGVEQLSAVFAPTLLGRIEDAVVAVEQPGSGGRRGTKAAVAAAAAAPSPLAQLEAAKTAVTLCRNLLEGHVRARAPSAAASAAAASAASTAASSAAAAAAAAPPRPLTRSGSKRAAADSPDTRATVVRKKAALPPGHPPGYTPGGRRAPPPGFPPTAAAAAATAAKGGASTGLTKYLQNEHLDWDYRRDD